MSHGVLGLGIRLPTPDGVPLVSTLSVKSLGVILNVFLSLEVQVTAIARSAFYHHQLIRQLVPYLVPWTTVIHVMLTSGLGYSTSLYMELSLNLLRNLWLVQNAATHMLIALAACQIFKVMVLTLKALYG